MITEFPREDLAPLRQQQVRALLVREAAEATSRRRAVVRRAAPALAALTVVGLAGAVTVPGTPLGRRIGEVVASAVGQGEPDADCNGHGVPRPGDDTSPVLFRPGGLRPTRIELTMPGICVGYFDPSVPTPIEDPWDSSPLWTLVRTSANDTSLGTVTAFVTLWRSLPPGVSADAADGRSTRRATDAGDPGTVTDPPFERIAVRGGTGTLVRPTSGWTPRGTTLTWTEPDGRRWSVTADGLPESDVIAFADALVLRDGELQPGVTAAVPRSLDADRTATEVLDEDTWFRLDVTPAERRDPPTRYTAVVGPYLTATYEVDGRAVQWEASGLAFPWQATVVVGERLVAVDNGVGLLDDRDAAPVLHWTLPSGVSASVTGAPEPTLVDLAASVEKMTADDARQTVAPTLPSDPGASPAS